jgi:hypothetical protein
MHINLGALLPYLIMKGCVTAHDGHRHQTDKRLFLPTACMFLCIMMSTYPYRAADSYTWLCSRGNGAGSFEVKVCLRVAERLFCCLHLQEPSPRTKAVIQWTPSTWLT